MATPRDIARDFLGRGWAPIPVPLRSKAPGIADWPQLRVTPDNIELYFDEDQGNVGVLLGEPSNGLGDVDLDCNEAVRLAPLLLQRTQSIFGRRSARQSHWLYVLQPAQRTTKFAYRGECLVELRGTGGQTIFPGSVHPEGEAIEWETDGDPAVVDGTELATAVAHLAAAALLVRHYPHEGSRQDFCIALAGGLLRAGLVPATAKRLIDAIATVAGDEEVEKRLRGVESTEETLRSGRKATGWPKVAEILGGDGDEIVRIVRAWLGDRRADSENPSQARLGGGDDWPEPSPLRNGPPAPTFPLQTALPPACAPVRDFLAAVAEAVQVPIDLPAMLMLPVAAVALARKYEVEPRPGWREPCCVWTLPLLESGNRKSTTLSYLVRPIYEWERAKTAELGPIIAAEQEQRRIDEKRLERLRKKAAGGHAIEATQAATEALELAQRLASESLKSTPQLVTGEPTPEALAGLLVRNDERMLLASAEADSLDVMLGRYSRGTPNFGVFLAGHAGDPYRVDRKSRPSDHLSRPTLSVALLVQPSAVEDLFASRQARGRGMIARFLACAPESLLGRREIEPPPVPASLIELWSDVIRGMLDLPMAGEPEIVVFDEAAADLFRGFQARIEPDLGRGGGLQHATEWGGKLCGAVARIALVLHGLMRHGLRVPGSNRIDEETMTAALSWAPYLIDHERIVAGLVGESADTATAERVLTWLAKYGRSQFSRRDAFNACRSQTVQRAIDIDPALELLEDLNYLRPSAQQNVPGPGRKPSPEYVVNPRWQRLEPGDQT